MQSDGVWCKILAEIQVLIRIVYLFNLRHRNDGFLLDMFVDAVQECIGWRFMHAWHVILQYLHAISQLR